MFESILKEEKEKQDKVPGKPSLLIQAGNVKEVLPLKVTLRKKLPGNEVVVYSTTSKSYS